ncbi:hypothetical protein J1N35_038254 [Gossypium stocksii]|uniref:Uncharacterized protein n=1 Tax=Gossypium stocksii TaxID=47602 RepID=A0A9D3ULI9_9ROSI|nr:hypothetical protein J1N35_038254 [Gossypium stocksii]
MFALVSVVPCDYPGGIYWFPLSSYGLTPENSVFTASANYLVFNILVDYSMFIVTSDYLVFIVPADYIDFHS